MAKGKIITAKAVPNIKKLRSEGKMIYVDKEGNIRATAMNRKGGKKRK